MNKLFHIFLIGTMLCIVFQVVNDLRMLDNAIQVEARTLQTKK